MVKKTDIAAAVTAVLTRTFPNYKVYSDEVKEGYKTPSFFVELISTVTTETVNFCSVKLSVIITYLPSLRQPALEVMDMEDRLREAFGMVLKVGNRQLKITSLQGAKTGEDNDIVQVTLTIDYLDSMARTESADDMIRELKFTMKEGN